MERLCPAERLIDMDHGVVGGQANKQASRQVDRRDQNGGEVKAKRKVVCGR